MAKKPKHISKRLLAAGEELLIESRQSKIKYMTGGMFSMVLAIAFFIVGFWNRLGLGDLPYIQEYLDGDYGTIIGWVLIAIGALLVVYFLVKYLRWISTLYVLTNQRVMIKRGIIGRSIEDMSLTMITNIDVRQTALQRFLGYGTIAFSSEGGNLDDVVWRYVPDPFKVRSEVQSAMAARLRPKGP
ncbi:MAG: PH domain-containing protein [Thermoplasmata archaeon]